MFETILIKKIKKNVKLISVMPYPAHSRVSRGNLVLRNDVLDFPQILESSLVEWRKSTPRFSSTSEQRIENINFNKYLISWSGDQTWDQSRLQSHFVPLQNHDWP